MDPLKVSLDPPLPPNDPNIDQAVLNEIIHRILESKRPIVVGNVCAARHGMEFKVQEFIAKAGLPSFFTPMGRGTIDERDNPQFGGVYMDTHSRPEACQASDIDGDLALSLGGVWSDMNTGAFTAHLGKETGAHRAATVELHSTEVTIGYAHYDVGMASLIPQLTEALAPYKQRFPEQGAKQLATCSMSWQALPLPSIEESAASLNEESLLVLGSADQVRQNKLLTNCWFWPRTSHLLCEGGCVLGETGSSVFALFDVDVPLPRNTTWIFQVLWGSIGYAGGSVLVAALAQWEKNASTGRNNRTVLFIGDGS